MTKGVFVCVYVCVFVCVCHAGGCALDGQGGIDNHVALQRQPQSDYPQADRSVCVAVCFASVLRYRGSRIMLSASRSFGVSSFCFSSRCVAVCCRGLR